jgi:SAM-dependent methyltransferase
LKHDRHNHIWIETAVHLTKRILKWLYATFGAFTIGRYHLAARNTRSWSGTNWSTAPHDAGNVIDDTHQGHLPREKYKLLKMAEKKDYWSTQVAIPLSRAPRSLPLITHKDYSTSANFVYNPQITQKVLQYLSPQPNDRILDVGCGNAKFTANFLDCVAYVYGVDASPSFIESANQDYAKKGKAHFKVVDCRYLEKDPEAVSGNWDKVVSNAALHWILRDESTRLNTLKACYDALKPGGKFVFEMGGVGNVNEVHAALLSALMHQGLSADEARRADPWFFPSENWMKSALDKVGFQIQRLELEYRPTACTSEEDGGLMGWIRLMGGQMIESLKDKEKEEAVVREVAEVLETVVTREDGSRWLGYVRLRGVATRPE